jgi:hypothetical protein
MEPDVRGFSLMARPRGRPASCRDTMHGGVYTLWLLRQRRAPRRPKKELGSPPVRGSCPFPTGEQHESHPLHGPRHRPDRCTCRPCGLRQCEQAHRRVTLSCRVVHIDGSARRTAGAARLSACTQRARVRLPRAVVAEPGGAGLTPRYLLLTGRTGTLVHRGVIGPSQALINSGKMTKPAIRCHPRMHESAWRVMGRIDLSLILRLVHER